MKADLHNSQSTEPKGICKKCLEVEANKSVPVYEVDYSTAIMLTTVPPAAERGDE